MALTFAPFRELANVPGVASAAPNVGAAERIGSAVAGAALAAYGFRRGGLPGVIAAALGALLVQRGATGQCRCYRELGIDTTEGNDGRGVPGDAGIKIEKEITIVRPPMELYHLWRELENLPRLMPNLESVTVREGKSHWVVDGPAGHRVEWDAEVINDNPGELIAWQSLPGSEVRSAGSVHFEPVENGGGTRVRVNLQYLPPAGRAGDLIARVLGSAPDRQLEAALVALKERLEA